MPRFRLGRHVDLAGGLATDVAARNTKAIGTTARTAIIVIGVAAFMWLAMTILLGEGARHVNRCGTCHAMAPFAEARNSSSHAGVPCADCHATPGAAGRAVDGLRAQSMLLGVVFAATATGGGQTDAACRDCHAHQISSVTSASGVRVRHAEVAVRSCLSCHGGVGHRLNARVYASPQMEGCTECHTVSYDDATGCSFCHDGKSDVSGHGLTVWGATHGPGWKKTHGSGDLRACVQCHSPQRCASCHGIALPHPVTWLREHGTVSLRAARGVCSNCHSAEWCTRCHNGIEMPHPIGFLKTHGLQADKSGQSACEQCHDSHTCQDCHFSSAHPHVPGPGMKTPGVR